MDLFTRRLKDTYKLVAGSIARRRRVRKVKSALYQRNVYSFLCPYCDRILQVTHLRWSAIECLYCKLDIANSSVVLEN
mgnify:CR=1